jgi:hypothetical protein
MRYLFLIFVFMMGCGDDVVINYTPDTSCEYAKIDGNTMRYKCSKLEEAPEKICYSDGLRYNQFQDRCVTPLCQDSAEYCIEGCWYFIEQTGYFSVTCSLD